MNTPLMNLMPLIPISAIIAFLLQQSHLLMTLLTLESIMLSLVLFIPMILTHSSISTPYLSMILLTLGACEASLGLSLLVLMARNFGSDMVNNLTTNKC